ncbi:MAG: hypothetical protein ABEJ07_02180 [Candidatus Nanohaloarchaea archaeon]
MELAPAPEEPYIEKYSKPGEVYVKWNFERNPTKAAGRHAFMRHELEALREQHSLLPSYFPEPYYAVRDQKERVVAIGMEALDLWKPVREAASVTGPRHTEQLYFDIEDAVQTLHGHGNPHGDLLNNTWVDREGELAIVDPLGYREDEVWEEELMERDMEDLEVLEDYLL